MKENLSAALLILHPAANRKLVNKSQQAEDGVTYICSVDLPDPCPAFTSSLINNGWGF